jgi:Leucine-rich repeat (LRR) protein
VKKFNDGFEPMCKSKDDIDKLIGASCYFFDGQVYHSNRQSASTKSTGALNCSMEHLYEIERENKKRATESSHTNVADGTLSKLTLVDGVILGLFYCYGGLLLFVWRKEITKVDSGGKVSLQNYTRVFALSVKSMAYLLFLGAIGCLFGSLIFCESFLGVEKEYGTKYGFQPELHLSWVYFVLGGAAAIGFGLGLNNIVHALLNRTGQFINNTKEPQQQRKGLDKIVCVRWLKLYRNNTRPRGGKWFFVKMLVRECVEIILQTTSLHQFATNKPQEYVIRSSALLLINIIVTPILLYKSAHARADKVSVYNGIILTYDTSIDTMFFVLNLYYLEAKDLYENPFVGTASLIWPVVGIMMRLRSLGRLVLVQYLQKNTSVRPSSRSNNTNPHSRHRRRIMYVSAIFFGAAIFSLVQFVFIVSSSISINAKCATELGPSLWNGASPKYTFSNGIFGTPTCAYEKIKRIHADTKQLSSVSTFIGLCTNLTELNLAKNNIIDLPRELLMMEDIHIVDLTGNPVHSKLVARNMSLTGGIPPFIIRHLNASLEHLDLSNNFLNRVDESIGFFQELKVFKLDNNHLGPESLSREIVKLLNLGVFSLNGNLLEADVNWSNEFRTSVYLDEAIGFLKMHFKTSLKRLNVSHNALQRKHYDTVVQTFPKLVSFDISFNKNLRTTMSTPLRGVLNLTQLIFMSIEGNEGIAHIDLDELDEMERRMVNNITEFRIRNIGLKHLKISDNCRTDACAKKLENCTDVACLVRRGFTRTYPRELIKQIGRSIQTLRIENIIWEGFDTNCLCDFNNLLTFHWKYETAYKGMDETTLSACLYASASLTSFELVYAPVVPPPRIKLSPSISKIIFSMNVHVRHVSFPIIETPMNRSFAGIEMNAFSDPVPTEYGLFPVVTIGVTSRHNESSTISKDWGSFRSLQLNGHMRHDNIVGSTSQLTIERAAFMDDTNVTGPLFRVGPHFKCMRLSAQNES